MPRCRIHPRPRLTIRFRALQWLFRRFCPFTSYPNLAPTIWPNFPYFLGSLTQSFFLPPFLSYPNIGMITTEASIRPALPLLGVLLCLDIFYFNVEFVLYGWVCMVAHRPASRPVAGFGTIRDSLSRCSYLGTYIAGLPWICNQPSRSVPHKHEISLWIRNDRRYLWAATLEPPDRYCSVVTAYMSNSWQASNNSIA